MGYTLRRQGQAAPASQPSGRKYSLRAAPPKHDEPNLGPAQRQPQRTVRPQARQAQARPAPARQVRAQQQVGAGARSVKTLARYQLLVADQSVLPSFLGSVRLLCGPGNVDLGRIQQGIVALAVDHDTSQLIGRVESATLSHGELRAVASIVDLPRARLYKAEIDAGLRSGISPGFVLHSVEPSRAKGAGPHDMDVVRWEPYEVSSTAVPRNAGARITGEFAMTNSQYQAPSLQSTSDPDGLAIQCARVALRDGKGSTAQLDKLSTFVATFDALVAQGLPRDQAATQAAASAGIRQA